MFLSIIIPTFNEARFIGNTLEFLLKQTYDMPFEIIVADGGSTDDTTSIASNFPVSVLQSPERGRAQQMN
ncbi:MAG TPA: glycosyltransferase, partial [Chitinophagales bacterium]|nr:glycosyltransferase [Chitinophagales bacterium]